MRFALLLPTSVCLVWTMFLMWRVNSVAKTLQICWNLTFDFQTQVWWWAVIFWHCKCQTRSIEHTQSRIMERTLCEDNHYIWSAVVLDNISLWDPCSGGFTTSVLSGLKETNHCLRLICVKYVCNASLILKKVFLYETLWVFFFIKEMLKINSVCLLFPLANSISHQSLNICRISKVYGRGRGRYSSVIHGACRKHLHFGNHYDVATNPADSHRV